MCVVDDVVCRCDNRIGLPITLDTTALGHVWTVCQHFFAALELSYESSRKTTLVSRQETDGVLA
jgi:hypothetical protein